MKRLKLVLAYLLLVTVAIVFIGCKNEPGGDDDAPPANSVSIPTYSNGKILKNKVVSLNEGGDNWYEYLTFESESDGKYALYKNGTEVKSYKNRNGEEVAVPAQFSYDSATGKFSAGDVSSYMFEARKDGSAVSVIAAEEMKCSAEKPTLCAEWSTSKIKFTFDVESNVKIAPIGGNAFTVQYTNDDGWITAGKFPLFYSSANRMFYLAYTTERVEVEAVGRNAVGVEIEFVSPLFILADIQL